MEVCYSTLWMGSHHGVAVNAEMVRSETHQGHGTWHDGSACHIEEEAQAGDQVHGPLHRADRREPEKWFRTGMAGGVGASTCGNVHKLTYVYV